MSPLHQSGRILSDPSSGFSRMSAMSSSFSPHKSVGLSHNRVHCHYSMGAARSTLLSKGVLPAIKNHVYGVGQSSQVLSTISRLGAPLAHGSFLPRATQ